MYYNDEYRKDYNSDNNKIMRDCRDAMLTDSMVICLRYLMAIPISLGIEFM